MMAEVKKYKVLVMPKSKKRAWQTSLMASFIRLNATINALNMRNVLYVMG